MLIFAVVLLVVLLIFAYNILSYVDKVLGELRQAASQIEDLTKAVDRLETTADATWRKVANSL